MKLMVIVVAFRNEKINFISKFKLILTYVHTYENLNRNILFKIFSIIIL